MDGVPQMHPWDLKKARHTASGSLSESPDGVHLEYPAIEKHYGRAVSSGSRIRTRPMKDLYRSTPTVAERKHAA